MPRFQYAALVETVEQEITRCESLFVLLFVEKFNRSHDFCPCLFAVCTHHIGTYT